MRAVRKSFQRGATQIKLFTSGGVTSLFDPLHSGPTAEEIRAAVEVAEAWDTYVLTHSFSEKAIRLAIDNGVKSIEHAPFLTDEIAKVMIEKGIYLATAVSPVLEVDVEYAKSTYPPASFKKWFTVRQGAENMLQVLKRNPDLKVVLGSDLLGPWNNMKVVDDKMNLEFPYFAKALGNFRALKMATSVAGEMNLMTGKMNPYTDGPLGVVKEGGYADLLLVDGNPLEDIKLMTDPDKNFKVIMKDGVIYKNTLLYEMFTPEQNRKIRKLIPHVYGDYNYLRDQ
jgi:imidazolonepropionase-like amidohydrolase